MEEINWDSHTVRDFSVGNVSFVSSVNIGLSLSFQLNFLLQISKPWSVPKLVRQLHFIDWPDFGCPENPEMLISFIHTMRSQSIALTSLTDPYHNFPSSPILVHCRLVRFESYLY